MNSKVDTEQPLGNAPSGSVVSGVQIIQILKVERRSFALIAISGGRVGGGTSQHPATSVACSVDGSIKEGGRTRANGTALRMKNESSDGAVGGGAFVAQ